MKFEFFKPSSISPQGWLKKQLDVQKKGLSGNLDKIWLDVKDSKWLGGNREGWERLPYFLDGFIPLAALTGDEGIIARAKKYADCILSCQDEEGRFRPKNDTDAQNDDIWSQFLIMKMLTVYADCLCNEEKTKSVECAILNCLKFVYNYINFRTLYNWAAARWYECLIPIKWLLDKNPSEKDENLLRLLAMRLRAQGMDISECVKIWQSKYTENVGWNFETHVVNIAMALKSGALYKEVTDDKSCVTAEKMLAVLDKKHGTAYGHFTGDECLSGLSAIQGSELCGVVEAMYSYEWLFALTGNPAWSERLEALAFNGLPATVSEDMWTHQYDQQVNQIACKKFDKTVFRTNGTEANVFGLEPNYGCCTANFSQGFPKFALSAYMKEGDKLVVLSPVPMKIKTEIGGKTVNFQCITEYPFRNTARLISDNDLTVKMPVHGYEKIKVRSVGSDASIGSDVSIDSNVYNKQSVEYCENGGWIIIKLKKDIPFDIEYIYEPKLVKAPEGGYVLRYGALLFALPIAEKKEKVEYVLDGVERKYPYCDYYLTPESEWRYAFTDDNFTVENQEYDLPFSRSNPPIKIKATLAPVKWKYEKGYDLIASKTLGKQRVGENETLKFQPYGSTNLRVTVLSKIPKKEK